jgi:rhodanese-related sulfurtransferase
MPAIISDQFRILNAENFVKNITGVANTTDKYYTFIGMPNALEPQAGGTSDWTTNTPSPLDGFKEENEIKQSIIAMKQITSQDVRRLVRKVEWVSGTTYEMYRHDYSVYNRTPVNEATSLYQSNYYVINDDLRVYICLQNGTDPENPSGKPSYDKPDFIDLEPRSAGTSGDGYIWKYLFTIKPSEIVKFDSIEYIPVPENWGTTGESTSTRNNAVDGKVEKGDKIKIFASNDQSETLEVGIFAPGYMPVKELRSGEIGYIITGLKNVEQCSVGDTITLVKHKTQDENFKIIDIRSEDQRTNKNKIPGAIQITAFDKNGNFFPDFFEKYKENIQIGEKVIFISQNGDISSILANGFVEQLNQTNIYHLKDGVSGLEKINFDFE